MGNPHVLVVPYPVQGHVIPLMELAQCLAKYGIRITFVNSEYNHELLKNESALQAANIGDRIRLVSISDGLQSMEDGNQAGRASGSILRVMPGKVEELIERTNESDSDKISCIIADQSIGWALELAEKKGIRRAAFCPAAAALLVLGFSIPKLIEDGIIDENGTPTKRQKIELSASMPLMDSANFVWNCLGNMEAQKTIFGLMVRNNKSTKLTKWLLCNSAYDLEPSAFHMAPHILPIGPLLASNKLGGDSTGNFWAKDTTCLEWLDQQAPRSVIYVAFGSIASLEPSQFKELCVGLELASRPFLLVARSDRMLTDGTNGEFVEEFKDRVGNRGKIVSWAPQQEVLGRSAVGCFLSHCGWNSTIESVSNGVPLLCWPCFADQFINKSYICDVWKVGLGLDKDENDKVTREEIKNKIEQILETKEFAARALDLKEKVMNCVKEGGSSHQNFLNFVDWIKMA
ncbi:hypothetical protein K2173_014096 [Erythroxylum novogranatense]|uniref:Glycosyltransferase n=1 Tax=Erythroxylum novogranatense TaxID=1862640 RepID=A0AAV8SDR9_9ROSI|nr:hypothetical protein K2173_014096 [Erythroxylum novogranatense]